jgi:MOSC domain-containing protein YiiM
MHGIVRKIYISPSCGDSLEEKSSVEAVAGFGIVGDRYYKKAICSKNTADARNAITLIDTSAAEICRQRIGRDFSPKEFRRNLIVEGIDLNDLVGKSFKAGEAEMKGYELCHPCKYLSELLDADVLKGLEMCGGLRAEITGTGRIKVGDSILEINERKS